MKNHRFDRYLYMGITAVLVLAAATAVIFLFLERKAILALGGRIISILDSDHLRSRAGVFIFACIQRRGPVYGRAAGKENEK